ncbi:UNVERIFIED_CONTAM: hypothetical protein RMT77_001923 [Armadillidium vulgare]
MEISIVEVIFKKPIGKHLPKEIWENIFAQLPLQALLSVYSRVCKYWAEIISDPIFLPWKKFYLSLKLERKSLMSAFVLNPTQKVDKLRVNDIMIALLEKYNIKELRTFLPDSVRFMGQVHRCPEDFETSCDRLKHHKLFSLAMEFLNRISVELIPKPHNVWHLSTSIIILSEDVWDICHLLKLLLSPNSQFTATDIVESFYSLASLFLYASRNWDLSIRYHYILYYSLYLYETAWNPTQEKYSQSHINHAGQQSLLKYFSRNPEKPPTAEQAIIISHNIQPTDVVKIVAFAGTGKTTTLQKFCSERPHMRFLLVVYNKSVQEYCSKIFPPNTQVKTAHALAFAKVGRKFNSIGKMEFNLRPMRISDILKKKEDAGNRYRRAGLVKKTVENFLNSADPYITLQHVPENDRDGVDLDDDYRLLVLLDDAEKVWEEMTLCTKSQKISMTQDGQLKMWQLSKPKLSGFDVLMIDEGQDMNPTMFDVFLNQEAAKVIVGDPYQQIYSFRGATNAIQSINATHTFYLTQSFRFGPEISFVSHNILENLLNVKTKTLVGGSLQDSVLHNPLQRFDGTQRAYLCRTNLCLYKLALQLCKDPSLEDKIISVNGGVEKMGLEDILDIMKLHRKAKDKINNKFIARFESLDSLIAFAENVDDKELINKINMYKYSSVSTEADIRLLRARCISSSNAHVILSTIHKAKGLEWDWVILADDMLPDGLQAVRHDPSDSARSEINLLYVASTRAKKRLTINTAVLHSLNFGREKFERLVSSSQITPNTLCVQCGGVCVNEKPLITKLYTLPLSCVNYKFNGGYICDKCAKIFYFEVAQNPRRLLNLMSESYVRDTERICRLVVIEGKVEPLPQPQLNYPMQRQIPIRWDKYKGNRNQ